MALRASVLNLGALAVAEYIRAFENIYHVGVAGDGVETRAVRFRMKEYGRGIAQYPENVVLAPEAAYTDKLKSLNIPGSPELSPPVLPK